MDPILAFGIGPWILPARASAKRSKSTMCSGVGGGGVLQAKRSRSTACSGAGGDDVIWVKWSRSTACSGAEGGDVLRAKRSKSREKQSSGIEGALRRRRHALGVGSVEDLKHTSGENLLSVEQAARAPDIYIGVRYMTRVH
jgi:hypothetical protein